MNTTETPNSAPAPQQHNGTSQAHHAHPVATPPQTESDPLPMKPCNAWFDEAEAQLQTKTETEAFTDETFSECLHKASSQPQKLPGLITRTASERLNSGKTKPPVTPLFDDFWLSGELAFLFGETGVGKSILAVQIADAISKGAKIQGFDGPQEPMRVGYFDFEHSTRQFARRYQDESGNRHKFSPNFLRAEINARAAKIPKGMNFQDFLLSEIEKIIIKHRLEVVVIDSLTYLLPFITVTKVIIPPKGVLEFMSKLRLLKLRNNISILVTGHTTKKYSNRPLTERDIAVSNRLINFCDSVFAIGESAKEKNVRYLKQIKTTSVELRYDIGYVAVFRLVKRNRFLGFEHTGFDCEYEHL